VREVYDQSLFSDHSLSSIFQLNWAQLPGELLELLANGNRIRRISTILEQSSEVEESSGDWRKLRRLEVGKNHIQYLYSI
jgi:hypothetical protein